MYEFLVKFDLLRRRAGERSQQGGTFPDPPFAARRLQNANSPNLEESVALASAHGRKAMAEIAKRMRRLWGPTGAPVRKDALMPDDDDPVASPPAETEEQESRLAYRRAEEKLRDAPRRGTES